MSFQTIIIDPGHGMGNRRAGVFDPGVVYQGVREADIVMDWANELRAQLRAAGKRVIRTRVNHADPAPIGQRAGIARHYGGDVMVSIHVNSTPGAQGTETFYRGAANKPLAERINAAVVSALGTRNRGAKTEEHTQHARLAVMAFQPTFLIELGFIEHDPERVAMLDPVLRARGCAGIVAALVGC
jgi:N-acetylmuramoyl-L-alanine amidase